ncbi:hypothetical protein [Streptomyces sp. NPDC005732]|uniref:hypothetical protein n=1 Tax=Streptomyces sp. NPDC005732 TaxID=3157057 RepID=UPI0033E3493D
MVSSPRAGSGRSSAPRAPATARADHIYVLDRGRVAEEGTHARLMALDGGLYRRMYAAQAAQYGLALPTGEPLPAPRTPSGRRQEPR